MSFSVLEKKTEYEETLAEFANIHYQTDGLHDGFVHLCVKGDDGIWRSIGSQHATEIGARLMMEKYRKRDYYITANAMRHATQRNSDDIYTLHNVVVDIDWHDDEGCRYSLDEMIELIADYRDDDDEELPMPNTVVFTGRGFQLWFAICPLSHRAMQAYARARNHIIEVLQGIPELRGTGVDMAPSKNAAGVFRLPGSWNQAAGIWGDFRIIHDAPLDVDAYLDANALRERRKQRMPSIAPGSGGCINTSLERERALKTLLNIRQTQGSIKGQRDLFLFCIHCIWSHLPSSADIMDHVRAFNELFAEPLSADEVTRYMSAANEKRYQATNATIIDRLGITEAEQAAICLFPNKRAAERQAAREKKAERNSKILKLSAEGMSVTDIAKAVGCSRPTVYDVLQAQEEQQAECKKTAPYNKGITVTLSSACSPSPSEPDELRSALSEKVTSIASVSARSSSLRACG